MQIRLSEKAIKEGVIRVWLRSIPDIGGVLHAFAVEKPHIEKPIGMATLYGRGEGSMAQERTMLYFRLSPELLNEVLEEGDLIEIKIEGDEEEVFCELELDIVEVE